ncbi:MAG: hypothetical protein AB7E31_14255 [Desulfitobacterium sp.]
MSDMVWTPYENAINMIRSIISSRIKGNEANEIEEIHVIADSQRNPKQIVRDIESILAAQFSLEIDHKIVSIVQLEQEECGKKTFSSIPAKMAPMRPKLVSISLRSVNTQSEVKVELSRGDEIVEGVASGISTAHNKLRLCVEATIQALASSFMGKLVFATEDVIINRLGKHQIAQVAISLITPVGEQTLVGCALVQSDEREAVVKAALDAVNRKLEL